uniref:Uncharacterized protein n=1 Tax=Hemiselmis andersenii TaxID=464988 RepID=A0A6U4WV04_HEMAN
MARVASHRLFRRRKLLHCWILDQIHLATVIGGQNETSVWRSVHSIDVTPISASLKHPHHTPTNRASDTLPPYSRKVCCFGVRLDFGNFAPWLLRNLPEEQLIARV